MRVHARTERIFTTLAVSRGIEGAVDGGCAVVVSASRIQLLVEVAEGSARVRRAGAITVRQSAELSQSLSVPGARSFLRGNPVLRISPASRQGCQRTLRVCRLRWRREGGEKAAQRSGATARSAVAFGEIRCPITILTSSRFCPLNQQIGAVRAASVRRRQSMKRVNLRRRACGEYP